MTENRRTEIREFTSENAERPPRVIGNRAQKSELGWYHGISRSLNHLFI